MTDQNLQSDKSPNLKSPDLKSEKSANLKSPPSRRLSPWNPLDHLRLLWWVLVTPQQLVAYREAFGENAERSVSRWLVSTLTLLPPFIPILAIEFGTLPFLVHSSSVNLRWLSCGVALVWALTGWLGRKGISIINQGGIVLVLALLIMLDPVVGPITSTVPVWRLVILSGLVVAALVTNNVLRRMEIAMKESIEESLKSGRPSWLARCTLGVVLLVYFCLVWFSFLKGWRVLR
jgi:hypothetical protein